MKNVLVIGMSSSIGGIETFLIQTYRYINKADIHFDFLTFFKECAFEKELTENKSKVFHITRRGENPVKCYFEQKKFFKEHSKDYDFVWIHLSSASNIISHKLARKYTNAKIISHCHGIAFESKDGLVKKIHTFFNEKNFKKFMECTDYRFACSNAAANWLFKTNNDVQIIKNGIDTEKFALNSEIRNEVREELRIDDKTFVLGHIGRFCEAKNHSFLIDIFNEYHKMNENSVLILAGSGELENAVKEKVNSLNLSSCVNFLGFRDDVHRLYQAFDAFLLPSLYEGFPLSVVEAQASGLSCFLSDNVPDEIDILKTASFLPIKEGDEKVWASKITAIDVTKRCAISQENAIKKSGYDINDTVTFLEKFFRGDF